MPMKNAFLTLLAAAAAMAAAAGTIELKTAVSSCRIDLEGARIVSFRTDGEEVLWNDRQSQPCTARWAHGGIPICWPRFGVDESGAIHGFAWRRPFALRSRRDGPTRSEAVLALADGDARLEYTVVLTDALTLEATTVNAGTNEWACSFGFHPYLRVAESAKSSVEGADGLSFEDDPSRERPERGVWKGTIRIDDSIDRIFKLPDAPRSVFTLDDAAGGRRIVVAGEGASHLNVWNPGPAKNCPGTISGDGWRHFVCVEPIFVGGVDGRPVPLPPGERRTLKMTIWAKTRVGKDGR